MIDSLDVRVANGLARDVAPAISAFAARLGADASARAVLFYGSNLRTGSFEGVLDYYVLLAGPPEKGIWPRVSYHEWRHDGIDLRAKVATMTLAKFARAASGTLLDTTIWARFCQPCALVWTTDDTAEPQIIAAVAAATKTAVRLAAAAGPRQGREDDFWLALFAATYKAEFRMETVSRARSILDLNRAHFEGLLPLAMDAAGIAYVREGEQIAPRIEPSRRTRVMRWWKPRRRLGKPINLLRLVRASATFEGAARYAAWKIERHTGVPVKLTPWKERHPVLAAPAILWSVWRARKVG